MRTKLISTLAALAIAGSVQALAGGPGCAAAAAAGEGKGGCCKAGSAAKMVAGGDEKGGCAGKANAGCAAACSAMPKMLYKVGEKVTCCSKEAGELALEGKNTVKFVVADKTYEDKGEALTAYAELLDKHLNKITTVSYVVGDQTVECPMAAQELAGKSENKKVLYRVGGTNFEDKARAEKAAKAAREAADKIAMKMVVDDQPVTGCPIEAKQVAEKDHKKFEYVVGDVHTPCEKTARVELAKARIMAAIELAAKESETKTAMNG